MSHSAKENEGTEENEDFAEWQVFTPQKEIEQHAGNGDVGRPDAQVGDDVQPTMSCRPASARPTSGEVRGIEQSGDEIQNHVSSFFDSDFVVCNQTFMAMGFPNVFGILICRQFAIR